MNITFDDQQPVVSSAREQKLQKGFSFEKKFLEWGIAKNRKQAAGYALVTSIGIIAICGIITFTVIRPEPVDESRYYDPTSVPDVIPDDYEF